MSIFRRDQENDAAAPDTAPTRREPRSTPPRPQGGGPSGRGETRVATGTRVTGEIRGGSDVVVEGELDGEIDVDSNVSIASGGTVTGNISARSVQVGGRVNGNVEGTEKIEILSSGRLEGDVIAPRVMLAEGAFFKGKVEMTGTQGGGRPQRTPAEGTGPKAPPSPGEKTSAGKTAAGGGPTGREGSGGDDGGEADADEGEAPPEPRSPGSGAKVSPS